LLSGFYRPNIENPDQLPLYLKHLIAVMTRPRCVHSASSEQQRRRFLKFLLNHPALKSAGRRKALMREMQEAIAGMDLLEHDRVLRSLSSIRMTKRSWRREPRKVQLMRKVLYFRQGGRGHTKQGYDTTAAQLLRFIRNFYAHTGGSTFNWPCHTCSRTLWRKRFTGLSWILACMASLMVRGNHMLIEQSLVEQEELWLC